MLVACFSLSLPTCLTSLPHLLSTVWDWPRYSSDCGCIMTAVIMLDLRLSVVERYFIVSDATMFTRSEVFMTRGIAPAVGMKMADSDFDYLKIIVP